MRLGILRGRETINFWEGYAKMCNLNSVEELIVNTANLEVAETLSSGTVLMQPLESALEGKYKLEIE